jgi:RNA polymerase sigma-70 factor (ECF subfamily)
VTAANVAPDADAAQGLVDHLFRHQAGKMVAVLVRILGPGNLDVAEDVVQDVLCRALETWKYGRLPPNPEAWLTQVAKNHAIDLVRRRARFSELAPDLARHLASEWTLVPAIEASFDEPAVRDGVLRMAFSCCDPAIGTDSQVAIILKYLCGFSVREIAQAFLTTEDTVEKRLTRGRTALKARRDLFDFERDESEGARLASVLQAIYLLFNEGYHGANDTVVVRQELCQEALRLGLLLTQHAALATPDSKALVALMCLHGARVPARIDDAQSLVTLAEQDRSRWDRVLIAQGLGWLAESSSGEAASAYHLEAAIAGHHAVARSLAETDWPAIRGLYDALYRIKPSVVVALNRAIAVGMAEGPRAGLDALENIPGREQLDGYPFYAAAMADAHLRLGAVEAARGQLEIAVSLARNPTERALLLRKLNHVGGAPWPSMS